MKSKVSINIDSDLLNIIRDCSDSDLDSIVQDALAQFLGLKQIWVRSNTLDPISNIPNQTCDKIDTPVKIDNVSIDEKLPVVKRRRQPKYVLKVWDKIKRELSTEFTTDDYWDATKISGLNYKDSARHSTILEHLKLIEEAGEIEKIGERPKRYRKLEKNEEKSEELSEQKKESEPKGSELERPETKQPIPKLFEDI